eukprot:scaffold7066_cov253-Pinguiococcus_pyrenoidosus.AAC.48
MASHRMLSGNTQDDMSDERQGTAESVETVWGTVPHQQQWRTLRKTYIPGMLAFCRPANLSLPSQTTKKKHTPGEDAAWALLVLLRSRCSTNETLRSHASIC